MVEASSDLPKRKRKSVQNVLETSDAVKFGELTPFEQILQRQAELESQGKKARILNSTKPNLVPQVLKTPRAFVEKESCSSDEEEFIPSESDYSSSFELEGKYTG